MRADRLLSLLMLLQSKGRMTARELAEQLEVSERTIYRDMEALGIAGIPVCAERGPGGGCFLIDGYQTKLTGLNAAEVRALFLFKMARPLADLGLNRALDNAMLKLSAALPVEQRSDAEQVQQRIHLDIEDWRQGESSVSQLPAIQEAVWHDRKLLIQYDEGYKQCQPYLIEPYGLVSKASSWYVVAMVAGEQRVFSVSRITTAVLSEEHFTRPETFDLSSFWATYCIQMAQCVKKPPATSAGHAALRTSAREKKAITAGNTIRRRTFSPQRKEKNGFKPLTGQRTSSSQKKAILKNRNGQSQQKRNSQPLKKEKCSPQLKKTKYLPLSFVA
ncbi:MAG TPA: WYL domain-containing protein [Ktedonobacteraceae bacterium]|nr:WYL domain-containing protein [Ktedonobacteraceae bacterium]